MLTINLQCSKWSKKHLEEQLGADLSALCSLCVYAYDNFVLCENSPVDIGN